MTIDWEHTRVRINVTGRAAWRAGRRVGWRGSSADHGLWVGIEGRGQMHGKGDASWPLGPGTCLWLTPGHLYLGLQDPDAPIRNYYAHFDLLDPRGHPSDAPTPPEHLTPPDPDAVVAVMRRITSILPFYTRDRAGQFPPERVRTAEAMLRGLLMDLDQSADAASPPGLAGTPLFHHEAIMRIVALVRDQPMTRFTVASLAREAGYTPEHFSRTFKSVMGQSPEQYLILHRILQAQVLLTTTSMPIREIARTLGYEQPAFFSTQFRKHAGCTPREFRRRRAGAQ